MTRAMMRETVRDITATGPMETSLEVAKSYIDSEVSEAPELTAIVGRTQ